MNGVRTIPTTILLLLLGAMPAMGETEPPPIRDRPTIGLVLSGGGAKGAAHIGVLELLEELHIPVDVIVGTSMGSIIGGLYASGMSAAEIDHEIRQINWAEVFRDAPGREHRNFQRKLDDRDYLAGFSIGFDEEGIGLPLGAIQGQHIMQELNRLTTRAVGIKHYDELPIQFRAVAADLVSGETVVLEQGDLALAMRASMSIPGIIAPVDIDGRLLIDGGIANNLPIDIAREHGADIIIAVDVGTEPLGREQLRDALTVTDQSIRLLTHRLTEAQLDTLTTDDILIRPRLRNVTTSAFDRLPEIIDAGRTGADERRSALEELRVEASEYMDWRASVRRLPPGPPRIDAIRINNQSRLGDDYLHARIRQEPDETLDREQLNEDLARLYGTGYFERVDYDWHENEHGETVLEIQAIERSWGHNFLRFGLFLEDDFDGNSTYTAAIGVYYPMINELGGEWRADLLLGRQPGVYTELWQPLAADTPWFVSPYFEFEREEFPVVEDGATLARFRVSHTEAGVGVGRDLGMNARIRADLRRGYGNVRGREGFPEQPRVDFDTGVAAVSAAWDSLDQIDFPTRGTAADIRYERSHTELGASEDFDQISASLVTAHSIDRVTGAVFGSAGTTLSGESPEYALFTLGGLLNMSGLRRNELAGGNFAHAGLMGQYAFGARDALAGLPLYVGATLEAGNVWEDRRDIDYDSARTAGSLFVGTNTVVGPIYLGLGRAQGASTTAYFYLGRFF